MILISLIMLAAGSFTLLGLSKPDQVARSGQGDVPGDGHEVVELFHLEQLLVRVEDLGGVLQGRVSVT